MTAVVIAAVVLVVTALLGAAGWKLGATLRGLAVLAVSAVVGVVGRVYGVEEFVLISAAIGVLLASGPLFLWQRTERAADSVRVEVRAGVHEVAVGGLVAVSVQVVNTGGLPLLPMRLESPEGRWTVQRPGLQGSDPASLRRQTPRPGAMLGGGVFGRGLPSGSWRARLATLEHVAGALAVPALAPGAASSCGFAVPTEERGLVTMPPLRLWCQDPFRLFANQVAEAPAATVVVFPQPIVADELPEILERASLGVAEAQNPDAQMARTSGSDLAGLRPYVPGDRLRLLHWPSLARTGALVVRYFESSSAGVVTVLVDDRLDVHDPDAFERAVGVAAGFCVEANAQGFAVDLRTASGDRFVLPPSAYGRQALLRALATLEPGLRPDSGLRTADAGDGDETDGDLASLVAAGTGGRTRTGLAGLRASAGARVAAPVTALASAPILITTPGALETLPDSMRRSAAVVVAR